MMGGKKYNASDFDIRVGKIITITRNRFGLSQKDLARQLGVTFQQIQKYETGRNRLPIGRLYSIAKCFGLTIGQLIDGSAQEYIHETNIRKTIELMYKMTPAEQRFILQTASYVMGCDVPGPARKPRSKKHRVN